MAVLFLFFLFHLHIYMSDAQQSYLDNRQLDCLRNYSNSAGFVCNGVSMSCPSFLTFRSTSTYNTPTKIASLLAANASHIASIYNIPDASSLPLDTFLIIPINCSCSQNNSYYQHSAPYTIKHGDTYFTIANNTYQALTTCQALTDQNSNNFQLLDLNTTITVPLRCACPTRRQASAGFKYLVTYIVNWGDSYNSIAASFAGAGADVESILVANDLNSWDVIFPFTPVLVPLKVGPTIENTNVMGQLPSSSNCSRYDDMYYLVS